MAARHARPRLHIQRAYVAPDASDGARVLVDRLWPRGCRKEALQLRLWLREVAPSDALRRWFGHDPARWPAFRERYLAELAANDAALAPLRALLDQGSVTLVYAAADAEHNNAVVLRDYLADAGPAGPGHGASRTATRSAAKASASASRART